MVFIFIFLNTKLPIDKCCLKCISFMWMNALVCMKWKNMFGCMSWNRYHSYSPFTRRMNALGTRSVAYATHYFLLSFVNLVMPIYTSVQQFTEEIRMYACVYISRHMQRSYAFAFLFGTGIDVFLIFFRHYRSVVFWVWKV